MFIRIFRFVLLLSLLFGITAPGFLFRALFSFPLFFSFNFLSCIPFSIHLILSLAQALLICLSSRFAIHPVFEFYPLNLVEVLLPKTILTYWGIFIRSWHVLDFPGTLYNGILVLYNPCTMEKTMGLLVLAMVFSLSLYLLSFLAIFCPSLFTTAPAKPSLLCPVAGLRKFVVFSFQLVNLATERTASKHALGQSPGLIRNIRQAGSIVSKFVRRGNSYKASIINY